MKAFNRINGPDTSRSKPANGRHDPGLQQSGSRGEAARTTTVIADTIPDAIRRSKEDHRTIARGAGVDETLISRLATGERRSMAPETADWLCRYFGLQLRAIRR